MQNLFKNPKFKLFLEWLILILLVGVLAYTLYQITTDIVVLKRRGIFSGAYRQHLLARPAPAGPGQLAEIQSWMTLRYVNLVFRLPQGYLKTQLGISDTRYPNISINTAAKEQKKTSSAELMLVQQKVEDYFTVQQPATSTP